MNDGLKLSIGDDGVFRKYEEPFGSIDCQTEEDYNKLVELLERGKKCDHVIICNSKGCIYNNSVNGCSVEEIEIRDRECESFADIDLIK